VVDDRWTSEVLLHADELPDDVCSKRDDASVMPASSVGGVTASKSWKEWHRRPEVSDDFPDDPVPERVVAPPMGVTIDDARAIVAPLPRSYEALVRDQVRFRVGRIVYAAFYEDETIMGFAFPKEEREALVASEPDKFLMPRAPDMRYRWVCVRLDAIEIDELRELLVDAWRMCVPNKVAAAYGRAHERT
jgi:hypothetical protein